MAEPTNPSLGWKLETWVIDMLETNAGFASFAITHNDADEQADQNQIVVIGKAGNRELEGAEAWQCNVEVRLYMCERDAGLVDSNFKLIEDTLRAFPTVDSLELFSLLYVFRNWEETKDQTGNTRERFISGDFLAIEADTATEAEYLRPDGTAIYLRPNGFSIYKRPTLPTFRQPDGVSQYISSNGTSLFFRN